MSHSTILYDFSTLSFMSMYNIYTTIICIIYIFSAFLLILPAEGIVVSKLWNWWCGFTIDKIPKGFKSGITLNKFRVRGDEKQITTQIILFQPNKKCTKPSAITVPLSNISDKKCYTIPNTHEIDSNRIWCMLIKTYSVKCELFKFNFIEMLHWLLVKIYNIIILCFTWDIWKII